MLYSIQKETKGEHKNETLVHEQLHRRTDRQPQPRYDVVQSRREHHPPAGAGRGVGQAGQLGTLRKSRKAFSFCPWQPQAGAGVAKNYTTSPSKSQEEICE